MTTTSPPVRQPSPAPMRDTIAPHLAGLRLHHGAAAVLLTPVPLFRADPANGERLLQAVRVLSLDGQPVSVTIGPERGEVLDQIATTGDAPAFLFVPERASETRYTVVARWGDVAVRGELTVSPQRKMTISLVQHSHFDIGYTDRQELVLASQLTYLDQAIALAEQTAEWPEEARFRWTVEVTEPLRRWLAVRPRAMREALFAAVRRGQIEICALSMNMHTEAFSIDELGRQLAFADALRVEEGLDITTAIQSDVPGATVGLVSLLADAGIRSLSTALNYAGRSVPHLVGGQDLPRPFFWRAPSGKRVLVWFTDSIHGNYVEGNELGFDRDYGTVLGNLPDFLAGLIQHPFPRGPFPEDGADGPALRRDRSELPGNGYLPEWLNTAEPVPVTKLPYPWRHLHLRVQGRHSDNAPPSLVPAEIARQWNETWAWPRLRTATTRTFFDAITEEAGDAIPTFSGDWTDWWADGIGSAPREVAANRAGQSDIRTAQTLHALADTLFPGDGAPPVAAAVDAAYHDLAIFDEHTWGSANPWGDRLEGRDAGALQWAWKASHAHRAAERAGALVATALPRLSPLTAASTPGSIGSFAVVNPSGWPRSDCARLLIPATMIGPDDGCRVVDEATGEPVPAITEREPEPQQRPDGHWLTLLARDVPALGYRRYRLERADAPPPRHDPNEIDASLDPLCLESDYLRLRVDLLAASIDELTTADGQSLIRPGAPFGMNALIRDRYTTAPGFNHHANFTVADGLRQLGSRQTARYGTIVARSRTPLWDRLTMRAEADGLDWLETTITLSRHSASVEISNRLHKPATPDKESLFFAFPFHAPDATVQQEITGGIAGTDRPVIPGAANYFRALRHWTTITPADGPTIAWATRDTPLVQTGTIALPYSPFPGTLPEYQTDPATIYSWVGNNLWDTNFPDRFGGEMIFRYVIAVDEGRPPTLGREAGATAATPLVGVAPSPLADRTARPLPPVSSLLTLDHPTVSIIHLVPGQDGHDLVAMIESTDDAEQTVLLRSELRVIQRAWTGTFLRRDLTEVAVADGDVRVVVPAGSLMTVSLDLA